MKGPAARFLAVALAAASVDVAPAAAAERYEDGITAYERNDFERSLRTMRPLADKGDARAQYIVGRHYQFGQGVKPDRAEAYFWYRRAETKGHLEAKLFRQLLEKRWKLTIHERARGEQRLAALNAPRVVTKATPKLRPTRAVVETAAREPAGPAITGRPSEPPNFEAERLRITEKPSPLIARAPAPASSPQRRPSAADVARVPPRPVERTETAALARERPRIHEGPTRERSAPDKPVRERPAPAPESHDREEADAGEATPYRPAPPPAETRSTISPPADEHASDEPYAPRYRTRRPPERAYMPEDEPYYAPAPPPTWGPPPSYYGPPGYHPPAWAFRPHRRYWHPGWRTAWRPYPGRRFHRGY